MEGVVKEEEVKGGCSEGRRGKGRCSKVVRNEGVKGGCSEE